MENSLKPTLEQMIAARGSTFIEGPETFWYSTDEESYTGPFASQGAAEDEANGELESGDTYVITKGNPVNIGSAINGGEFLDELEMDELSWLDDSVSGWLGVSKEQSADLDDRLRKAFAEWYFANGMRFPYQCDPVENCVVKAKESA